MSNKGHLDDRGVEQVRPLGDRCADQQAALAAADRAQPARRSDAAPDQIRRHRLIIVPGALLVGELGRLVPVGPEFAAAAQMATT
jgi:hypothetical protein